MIKRLFLLLAFLIPSFTFAQNINAAKIAEQIFTSLQNAKYALNDYFISVQCMDAESANFKSKIDQLGRINKHAYSAYGSLADVHESILKQGLQWKQFTIKNTYTYTSYENREIVVLVFQDLDNKEYIMEIALVDTPCGYKLVRKGVRVDYFSNETVDFIKKLGLTNHIPIDINIEEQIKPQDSTFIVENGRIIKSYYSNGIVAGSEFIGSGKRVVDYYYKTGQLRYSITEENNTKTKTEYYINGQIKEQYTERNNMQEGEYIRYYYFGQVGETKFYEKGKLVSIYKRFDPLGNQIFIQKFFPYENANSLEDFTWFSSYKKVLIEYISKYETPAMIYRKPAGWYVKKTNDPSSEALLWRFQDQTFQSLPSVFKYRRSSTNNELIKKYASRPNSQTLFSNYDNWSQDVLDLLSKSPLIPDSLQKSVFFAYADLASQALLKRDKAKFKAYFAKFQAMKTQEEIRRAGITSNMFSYQYMELALMAKSIGNKSVYKEMLSLVDFSPKLVAHGQRIFNECEHNALLLSSNGLLLRSLQLKNGIRTDVKVVNYYYVTKNWYRNLLQSEWKINFTLPDSKNVKFDDVEYTSRVEGMDANEFFNQIINKNDKEQRINIPHKVAHVDYHLPNGTYYALKVDFTLQLTELYNYDLLLAYIKQYPASLIMCDNILSISKYVSNGFMVKKLLPFEVDFKENIGDNTIKLALSIGSLSEIDSTYYKYYAQLHKSLIIKCANNNQAEQAEKLINNYMQLFGELESEIDLDARASIIVSFPKNWTV